MVLACASDTFYDIFNELLYARNDIWRAGTEAFRSELFPFEERAISRHFPSPPGTVLVGAAGGGREALALAKRGVPCCCVRTSPPLAASLTDVSGELPIENLVGRYEDPPFLATLSQPPVTIDLRQRVPFVAAILGWASISHIRSDQHCIATLRQFGNMTRGPILVSYLPGFGGPNRKFTVHTGYYRQFKGEEIRAFAEVAGLDVVHLDEEGMPHAVLRGSTTLATEITTSQALAAETPAPAEPADKSRQIRP